MEQTTAAASAGTADHLCVLVHGLWGNPSHLANVVKVLREKHDEGSLHILVAKRNSGSFTYDGIELGGERVCQEIEEEIESLAKAGKPINKLSIVGYSLGGLIARYATGLLYSRGVLDKVEPVNFTTFATPHLGVRTPRRGWHNHIWNVLGARTLSMSGRQLFIIDKFRNTGRPLLAVLADPNSIFIQGLAKFKRRTLYANIINDRSAVYYTTGISRIDPFVDLNNVKVNYLKGSEDVLIDESNPISPKPPVEEIPTWYARILTDLQSVVRSLPLYLGLIIFIPIGVVAFLVNSGIQTFNSSRRIRLHEAGRAGIEIGGYRRMPLLLTGMRGAVEDVYENLNSAQSNEYLASGGEEEGNPSSAPASPIRSKSAVLKHKIETEENEKSSASSEDTKTIKQGRLSFPLLALAPDQFAMIQALDDVGSEFDGAEAGWRKFPVHIHKVAHSHAAIIVRMNRKAFSEGYVVLKHWVDEEFLLQ